MGASQKSTFKDYCAIVAANFVALQALDQEIVAACDLIKKSLRDGGKVMFCGNGGSAADSQHLAAELMGRFLIDRAPLAAVALTVDTSALTAIGNDYSYDEIFARQLRGIGRAGDVLIGLSTSGNSRNVLRALDVAKEMGVSTIGLTGQSGGQMRQMCDVCIPVPSAQTNHIQEMHIAVGHAICGVVENDLCVEAG
jgi:D-sedoheptulose 7-phosphate isomerase